MGRVGGVVMSLDIPSLLIGKAMGGGGGGGGGDDPKLPDEYQRVEYLDFTPNAGFQIDIPSAALWEIVCSSDTTEDNHSVFGKKQYTSGSSGGDFNISVANADGIQSLVSWAKSGSNLHTQYPAIVEGEKVTLRALFTNTMTSAFIGMIMNRTGYYNSWDGKFYSLKGWDYLTQELLADFVPCYKKADTTIGIYDTVAKVFYSTISGNGTVAKGPDAN